MQTITEKSLNPIQAGSNNTYSVKRQLLDNFKSSKEYRHAFVEEKIRTQLAIQIKTIREQRPMSRPEFADLLKKAPSWVFRLEDPNQPPPTISTLLQVAEAFDVDLEISFRTFSGLLDRIDRLTPESFEVASFEEEVSEGAFEKVTASAKLFILPPKATDNANLNQKGEVPEKKEPEGINALVGGVYASQSRSAR